MITSIRIYINCVLALTVISLLSSCIDEKVVDNPDNPNNPIAPEIILAEPNINWGTEKESLIKYMEGYEIVPETETDVLQFLSKDKRSISYQCKDGKLCGTVVIVPSIYKVSDFVSKEKKYNLVGELNGAKIYENSSINTMASVWETITDKDSLMAIGFAPITSDSYEKVVPLESKISITVNDVTFDMILVESGTFEMGTEKISSNPIHTVTLSKDYYIGETEVTQGLWYAVMKQRPTSDGSKWSSIYGIGDSYPAYYISWNDVQDFISKLNAMTGQSFRMPTEAEWEYAARGGNLSQGYIFSGSNNQVEVAWYNSNSDKKPHPVATKQPNELGIYDMSGNVGEWCEDWYSSFTNSEVVDPSGPASGSTRVLRGGACTSSYLYVQTSAREKYDPAHRGNLCGFGFRLALTPSK